MNEDIPIEKCYFNKLRIYLDFVENNPDHSLCLTYIEGWWVPFITDSDGNGPIIPLEEKMCND